MPSPPSPPLCCSPHLATLSRGRSSPIPKFPANWYLCNWVRPGIPAESWVFSVALCLQWIENQIDFKAAIIKAPVSNSETHSLHVLNWKATLRTNGGYGWCIPSHSQQTGFWPLRLRGGRVIFSYLYIEIPPHFSSLGQSCSLGWRQKCELVI